ncbi:hypothetical protein DFJ73DRAFT_800551 [Zopfochytrium polystomum]|nr:hypothetical protein DFJ73DRAFT_800551 [Zopfochytrium polystomum]
MDGANPHDPSDSIRTSTATTTKLSSDNAGSYNFTAAYAAASAFGPVATPLGSSHLTHSSSLYVSSSLPRRSSARSFGNLPLGPSPFPTLANSAVGTAPSLPSLPLVPSTRKSSAPDFPQHQRMYPSAPPPTPVGQPALVSTLWRSCSTAVSFWAPAALISWMKQQYIRRGISPLLAVSLWRDKILGAVLVLLGAALVVGSVEFVSPLICPAARGKAAGACVLYDPVLFALAGLAWLVYFVAAVRSLKPAPTGTLAASVEQADVVAGGVAPLQPLETAILVTIPADARHEHLDRTLDSLRAALQSPSPSKDHHSKAASVGGGAPRPHPRCVLVLVVDGSVPSTNTPLASHLLSALSSDNVVNPQLNPRPYYSTTGANAAFVHSGFWQNTPFLLVAKCGSRSERTAAVTPGARGATDSVALLLSFLRASSSPTPLYSPLGHALHTHCAHVLNIRPSRLRNMVVFPAGVALDQSAIPSMLTVLERSPSTVAVQARVRVGDGDNYLTRIFHSCGAVFIDEFTLVGPVPTIPTASPKSTVASLAEIITTVHPKTRIADTSGSTVGAAAVAVASAAGSSDAAFHPALLPSMWAARFNGVRGVLTAVLSLVGGTYMLFLIARSASWYGWHVQLAVPPRLELLPVIAAPGWLDLDHPSLIPWWDPSVVVPAAFAALALLHALLLAGTGIFTSPERRKGAGWEAIGALLFLVTWPWFLVVVPLVGLFGYDVWSMRLALQRDGKGHGAERRRIALNSGRVSPSTTITLADSDEGEEELCLLPSTTRDRMRAASIQWERQSLALSALSRMGSIPSLSRVSTGAAPQVAAPPAIPAPNAQPSGANELLGLSPAMPPREFAPAPPPPVPTNMDRNPAFVVPLGFDTATTGTTSGKSSPWSPSIRMTALMSAGNYVTSPPPSAQFLSLKRPPDSLALDDLDELDELDEDLDDGNAGNDPPSPTSPTSLLLQTPLSASRPSMEIAYRLPTSPSPHRSSPYQRRPSQVAQGWGAMSNYSGVTRSSVSSPLRTPTPTTASSPSRSQNRSASSSGPSRSMSLSRSLSRTTNSRSISRTDTTTSHSSGNGNGSGSGSGGGGGGGPAAASAAAGAAGTRRSLRRSWLDRPGAPTLRPPAFSPPPPAGPLSSLLSSLPSSPAWTGAGGGGGGVGGGLAGLRAAIASASPANATVGAGESPAPGTPGTPGDTPQPGAAAGAAAAAGSTPDLPLSLAAASPTLAAMVAELLFFHQNARPLPRGVKDEGGGDDFAAAAATSATVDQAKDHLRVQFGERAVAKWEEAISDAWQRILLGESLGPI